VSVEVVSAGDPSGPVTWARTGGQRVATRGHGGGMGLGLGKIGSLRSRREGRDKGGGQLPVGSAEEEGRW
jgi:hypothetical protein